MKLKKHFNHSKGRSIWRLLLNNESTLLIEERDLKTREVFFQIFDIVRGKKINADLQLHAKFWVGVEAFQGDLIYFHGYKKPDMPWHQGIYAYSVKNKAVIWEHPEYVFSFIDDGIIVGIQQGFESSRYYAIDAITGSLIEELAFDTDSLKARRQEAAAKTDYSRYVFPEGAGRNEELDSLILQHLKAGQSAIESLVYRDTLFVTVQETTSAGLFNQRLSAIDIPEKKVIFSESLNKNQNTGLFDSYFIYDKSLVAIRNKEELVVYSMIT